MTSGRSSPYLITLVFRESSIATPHEFCTPVDVMSSPEKRLADPLSAKATEEPQWNTAVHVVGLGSDDTPPRI